MLGVIKGQTGSYDYGYFALSLCMVLAGAVMLTLQKETVPAEEVLPDREVNQNG